MILKTQPVEFESTEYSIFSMPYTGKQAAKLYVKIDLKSKLLEEIENLISVNIKIWSPNG